MLQDLTHNQLEQAFRHLDSPLRYKELPQELKELNEMEWFLVTRMLQVIMSEKENNPLQ